MRIITLSREFGSGGRELGKRLADELGLAYYDREIITAIAEKCSLDAGYVENTLNKSFAANYPVSFSRTFTYMPVMNDNVSNILSQQHSIITELAKKGDCIIVGRSADSILAAMKPFKIFVYADMEAKIRRCIDRRSAEEEKLTEREIEKKITQIDKARASYHNIISDIAWGDKRGYNLCINTTGADIKALVPSVAEYAKKWFESMK